jgi:hypothetical protein
MNEGGTFIAPTVGLPVSLLGGGSVLQGKGSKKGVEVKSLCEQLVRSECC